jgi:hypothetical protein
MASKILFNIASRQRPEKFRRLVRDIFLMCHTWNIEIVAKIDTDDPRMKDYYKPRDIDGWNVTYKPGVSTSKVHAVNRDIPTDDWDILVDVNDDFVFTKIGFDNIIRANCGPDDCVHFPEPYAELNSNKKGREGIIIMPVMGRAYYDRFGYVYNPAYKSTHCDNELTEVSRMLGRYKFVHEDIFYHEHPAAGFGVKDALLKRNELTWNKDERTLHRRRAIRFGL